jgi:cytoskeletal protein CcmA (bactofilin family)
MNHFDEMTALLYLEGQLDNDRAQEVRSHSGSCAECRSLLHALQTESIWLRASLEVDDESVPARLLQAPERSGTPWGWISALALGAAGAYTAWSGFIEPWQTQAAQAGFTQGNLLTMLFFSSAFWKGWDAMRSLTEFLAVSTLGMVVMWLLRRHLRRMTTVAVVMGSIICTVALAPAAGAADIKHGDPNYTLASGEVIHTDLIVSADSTHIDGDVDGDLITFSRSVTVNGHIKGDVISFSQELRVNGPVDGNVRAFVQSLQLNNTIGHNLMAWAEEVNLDEKAKVNGTMTVGSEHLELNGTVAGDLLAFSGDAEINGSLGHDARIRAGRLSIGSSAVIAGHTQAQLRKEPDISSSAKLGGLDWTYTKHMSETSYSSPRLYWHQALKWGASFVFGLVLLFLAPSFFFDTASACKKVGAAIGFGALFLFALPIAGVIVCLTVVGLGVGISAFLLWLIAIYAAQVFVGAWLGERVLGAGAGVGAALGRLALGLLILRAVGMVPFLGGLVWFMVTIWGMGAVILAVYKHMHPPLTQAAA